MKITVLVASHKPYWMPSEAPYLPIQVGAENKPDLNLGGVKDNEGENISLKNPHYCELTALYWAWKNLKGSDAVGLAHYRRHFGRPGRGLKERILKQKDFEALLEKAPIIVPPKRNYFIETVQSQYEHAHHPEDLAVLRKVIYDDFPDYLPALDLVMLGTKTHLLNMFVMRRDLFDAYCAWLFAVLGKVEAQLDISGYSTNDARVFGFLSERLLDVWLITHDHPTVECSLVQLERTNWIKKGFNFLVRKFRHA